MHLDGDVRQGYSSSFPKELSDSPGKETMLEEKIWQTQEEIATLTSGKKTLQPLAG